MKTCFRLYHNKQLLSSYLTLQDAENGKKNFIWNYNNQTKEPLFTTATKLKPKLEIIEELINKD